MKESFVQKQQGEKSGIEFGRYFCPVIISPIPDQLPTKKEEAEEVIEPKNIVGWSASEMKALLELIKVHRFGWKKISLIVSNRSLINYAGLKII